MATYYTLLTNIGQAKIANALALNQAVNWSQMAVGDGNGNPTTPVQTQTALVRENYRAPINQLTVDNENPNYMVAEMIVPTNVGGWTVYEVGIFDADGDMVAVANFPATYKPLLEEGSGRDLVVRIIIQVSNASVVTLKVDQAIVLASQKWVVDNFVKKVTVAGGTTGQILAKQSNANEDFEWIDPTAAVSVLVDAKTERQTLAALQTVINLATLTTPGIAVYVEGVRLIETVDFTVNSTTQLTLALSYPAGTRIHMYQNDPTSLIADATESVRGFTTLSTGLEAIAGTSDAKAMTPKKTALLFPIRGHRIYNTAGVNTWAVPVGVTRVRVTVVGGGAGGGGVVAPGAVGGTGGGGGGGAYGVKLIDLTDVTNVTVTVGAGGSGGTGNTAQATAGGVSSFGSYLSASGGSPGGSSTGGTANGGAGGSVVTGADYGGTGSAGTTGVVKDGSVASAGIGGDTIYGACAGAPNATGNSPVAGNGSSGTNGAGGSGGAAFNATANGGAGGAGFVLIEW